MSLRFFGIHDCATEGKFLWEILTQLRGMGVGRYVLKTEWTRKWPDEPSYLKIVKAKPEMDRWLQEGRIWAEWTFRGRHLGIHEFDTELNRSDWLLVHRHEEEKLLKNSNQMPIVKIPSTFQLPPLQQYLTRKWAKRYGIDENAVCSKRANLDFCLEEQFGPISQFFERTEPAKISQSDSIYDEVDPRTILNLYGKMLPTKIDSWSTEPKLIKYRFSRQDYTK